MTAHTYCTLFDTSYMSRGLAMIESLIAHDPTAHVTVFAFDAESERILRTLAWPHVTVVGLGEFETPDLLAVKPHRKRGEYCWTSTPFVIAHCLKNLNFSACTYLDADLFFFSSPKPAFAEDPSASVLITEHRYTPRYDQTAMSGRYCVQFMSFKKNADGLEALDWWAQRCLEWCHDYAEDGKFGDQKYLDDWLTRFQGVHAIGHEGVGLAPWNVQQYEISKSLGVTSLRIDTGEKKPVVFYHFHAFKFLSSGCVDLGTYVLPPAARIAIYRPYVAAVQRWNLHLANDFGLTVATATPPTLFRKLRRARAGFPNILPAEKV